MALTSMTFAWLSEWSSNVYGPIAARDRVAKFEIILFDIRVSSGLFLWVHRRNNKNLYVGRKT